MELLDLAGILGLLAALGLGIAMRLDGFQTMVVASSYLAVCFLSSTLLCALWRIPRSMQ